ncbi:MAG: hypothetical protein ACE5I2_16655 [Anaerolineae bacterium]
MKMSAQNMNIEGQTSLRERALRDDALYAKHGRLFEAEHRGEFIAISYDGQTIVAKDDIGVLKVALERFGSGNFAFRRIGFRTLGKWRVAQ